MITKKRHLIKKISSFKTTCKKARNVHKNICPLHNNNSCSREMLQKYILNNMITKKLHLIKKLQKISSFKTTCKKAKEIHNNICPLHNNNSCSREMLQKYMI